MERRIVLRFRDLVTEIGGTVAEHRSIIRTHGEVWWGWWMRQQETPPRALFAEVCDHIKKTGSSTKAYLFDAGTPTFFSCDILDIKLTPAASGIASPDPQKTPEYYQRGRYPAWFLLGSLGDQRFNELELRYDSFPTRPELKGTLDQLIGQPVRSLDDLRHIDATLWVLRESKKVKSMSGDG